ncbi:hydrogenase subunit MbhD domain-containing protein [Hydrogenovibrio halophilus]|uniref:hydrogenase subunit MbhD domain-containing protein n=1 Tax=Hydrogenovibrio halophilus TaxID=373391 RepID=UPI00036D6AAE|nr:hydrogenase subunit MbhD domain-containing protein [Hydrogenovibrio halophilus]
MLDAILTLLILALAWHCVRTTDLFEAIVVFIALGMLVALAWTRLQAPDAALAEAAIGAGLAGALLLASLRQMPEMSATRAPGAKTTGLGWFWWGLWGALGLALVSGVAAIQTTSVSLMPQVQAHLSDSGVTHPVTAVLLNFRALDTALELAVLLWAWMAQKQLFVPGRQTVYPLQGQVLKTAVKALLPLMVLVAVYLLWRGSSAPGGAFQSGAVLASAWLMLWLAQLPGLSRKQGGMRLGIQAGWLGGVTVFLLVGLLGVFQGAGFMGYPPDQAGAWILLIESAAALSIGLLLASMVLVSMPDFQEGTL